MDKDDVSPSGLPMNEAPAGLRHSVGIPDAWESHKLCYVEGAFAYFTNVPLAKQWGDDWDDAPYEHNAETPYEREPGQIVKLAWEGEFCTPDWNQSNSPWSVQDINAGATPWLNSGWWSHGDSINAGASIAEFCDTILRRGGVVYFPAQAIEAGTGETEWLDQKDESAVHAPKPSGILTENAG